MDLREGFLDLIIDEPMTHGSELRRRYVGSVVDELLTDDDDADIDDAFNGSGAGSNDDLFVKCESLILDLK